MVSHMEEKLFTLMHRNDPVCSITVDPLSGSMLRISKPTVPELLPLGGFIDADALRKWWQRRAVPISQGNIQRILEHLEITTPQEYLVRNLGLSLVDHYWIKPLDMPLHWEDVNLFTNDFRDPVGDLQFGDRSPQALDLPRGAFSPSSATQGDLKKKWIIADGKRYLIKGNHGGNSQESLNEIVATLLHRKQEKQPYTTYSALPSESADQLYCICESFTSENVELIPAIDVIESEKKSNNVSTYEHFISVCSHHDLDETVVRPFLEYQILSDFVLTNTDRHFNNFGVLRDSRTLQFTGMAPIFDSGNSMFWESPRLPLHHDLTEIAVNSFRKTERQLLSYVHDKTKLDLSNLPTLDELREIYEQDPLIPYLDSILLGYQKKIDFLDTLK